MNIYLGTLGKSILETKGISSSAKKESLIQKEKEILAKKLNYKQSEVHILNQTGGNDYFYLQDLHSKVLYSADADAIFTKENVALIIRSADCLPLLFYSRAYNIIGAIHAGWKGCHGKIVGRTLKAVKNQFGKDIQNNDFFSSFYFFVGPYAHVSSYEVQSEFLELFSASFIRTTKDKNETKYFFNMKAHVEYELLQEGVSLNNILSNNTYSKDSCTMKQNHLFYSHRMGDSKRNLNYIYKK